MNKVRGGIILERIQEIMAHKTVEENTEMTVMIAAGIGLDKYHFPEIMAIIKLGVQAIVDQGQDLE